MSVLGDVVTIGGGGETASIWLTGDVQSTDIVTATKGSKTVNGAWTTISGVNGFLCDKINEFGTWTVTASRSGTAYYTQDVLVDAAERFDLTYSSRFYLYNEGDECTSVTGGWNLVSWWGSQGSITKETNNIYILAPNGYYSVAAVTLNLIDLTSYTKLYINVLEDVKNGTGWNNMIILSNKTSPDTASYRAGTVHIGNTTGISSIDVSAITGKWYIGVYVNSQGSGNCYARFNKIWLE